MTDELKNHICTFVDVDPFIGGFMGKTFVFDQECGECKAAKAVKEYDEVKDGKLPSRWSRE